MSPGTLFQRFLTHQFSKLRANRTSAETRRNFELREATRRIMVEESITSRRSRRFPTSIFSHPRFRRFIEKAQRVWRQSSQSVRSAASNRGDKSKTESHLGPVRVS